MSGTPGKIIDLMVALKASLANEKPAPKLPVARTAAEWLQSEPETLAPPPSAPETQT